ncbi:hypothetical protein R1sor_013207 [Riccia sorocarpa]|uniref:Methyltransferase type 11 domain-containing protein n=1 Tax=Riccia sorocarpa TaxID=122646 RepID=A0ABD3H5V6_9MARC
MRETFAAILPDIPILDGTASSIPPESASQDVVIVAQTFHWFAQIETLREIHRVLKPGVSAGALDGSVEVWKTKEAETLFSKLEEAHFEHEMLCSFDMVWGRVRSKSYIACQSDEVKKLLKEQVFAALQSAEDLELDASGLVRYPYKTDVYWCAKI